MLKKVMLAGLMTATVLGGIAPAYAQRGDDGHGDRRGERAERPAGNAQQDGRRWRERGNDRAGAAAAQPGQQRADRQWRGDADGSPDRRNWRNNRGTDDPIRPVEQRPDRQWRDNVNPAPGATERQNWRNDRRDDRRGDRRDWRNDHRDDRQDWRNDRRNDWRGNDGNWNNDRRRYDDRTRWSSQRRWDNGWRQDRRYDWQSYRGRYGDRYRVGRYYAPHGWSYGYRRFSTGIFLSGLLYSNSYWLDDPYSYRLPPAYGTLRWIRYYDDALLVDIRDGYVVDVIHDFFW